jgi:hypothetical protein
MEKVDGRQALGQLATNPHHPAVPTLMLPLVHYAPMAVALAVLLIEGRLQHFGNR